MFFFSQTQIGCPGQSKESKCHGLLAISARATTGFYYNAPGASNFTGYTGVRFNQGALGGDDYSDDKDDDDGDDEEDNSDELDEPEASGIGTA